MNDKEKQERLLRMMKEEQMQKEGQPEDHPIINQNPTKIQEKKSNIMKEYKILSQKDKWFSSKFDPAKLEEAINSYAQQGWRVISCATASIPGMMTGSRDEMIIVLERDK